MTKPSMSQNPKEFAQLLKLYIETRPQRVLEIGTHVGGTFYYWLKFAPQGALVGSIDVQRINSDKYANWCGDGVNYGYFTSRSDDPEAFKWAEDWLSPIDWLFIDGGHTYSEIWSDFNMYSNLMNKNGVIAFHDICSYPPYNSEVDLFWNKIKRKYNSLEIIEHQSEGWGLGPGIGVIFL